MTTETNNPWLNMGSMTQRRAVADPPHNIYWITDVSGRYGFRIDTRGQMIDTENIIKLQGIEVFKRNITKDQKFEFVLLLQNNEDWDIFHKLCLDLIEISVDEKNRDQSRMIRAVERRLIRWQKILKIKRTTFTEELQMGLFAELNCLENFVIPHTNSVKEAVSSWVGADFDSQDFLLSNIAVEVKSYRSSRGEIIEISSPHQLESTKPLYLVTYALSKTEVGKSIKDIVCVIKEKINNQLEVIDLFENKLAQYGYVPELVSDSLSRFIVDKVNIYQVAKGFPKIVSGDLSPQITRVKYSIDLTQCREFILNENDFCEGLDG